FARRSSWLSASERFELLRVDLRDGFARESSSANDALRPAASDQFLSALEPAPFLTSDALTPGRLVSAPGGLLRFGLGAFCFGRICSRRNWSDFLGMAPECRAGLGLCQSSRSL